MNSQNNQRPVSPLLILVGVGLILLGIGTFFGAMFGRYFNPFTFLFQAIWRFFWPVVFLGLGAFVIFLASTGAFSRPQPPELRYSTPAPGKRLYRSTTDRYLAGVCGGIAEYFGMDPTLVRIIAVVLIFVSGFGIPAYIIGWLVIPVQP